MSTPSGGPVPRSRFVTRLAWSFIVLAGLCSALALLQNILLGLTFPQQAWRTAMAMREAQGLPELPDMAILLVEHMRLLAAALLVLSLATLLVAIGLLRRREWARRLFVAMLVLGVVANLVGAVLPYLFAPTLPALPAGAPPVWDAAFQEAATVMRALAALLGVVFAALFAWSARRLMAAEVRREFGAH